MSSDIPAATQESGVFNNAWKIPTMALFNKKPRPAVHRQQALNCIPIRNPETEEEHTGEGILLRYPVEVKPWFSGLFRHVAGRSSNIIDRKLQLDAMGSAVWEMIDGKRTVQQIADRFRHHHKLGEREAEISVSGFLRELGKRGLVAMREEKQEQDDA